MKLLYLGSVAAVLFIVVAANATPQDNATAEPKPMRLERLTPQGNFVQFVAATIVPRRVEGVKLRVRNEIAARPDRPDLGVPGTIIHLEGNVQITIFNRALMLHASTRDELTKEMILTADEADYIVDTGEIQPQGHVSIKPVHN
jgi:hypothetical protein